MDKGPWEVPPGEPGVIYSDDFTHDVCLRVQGDFDSDDRLAAYCRWLADTLNREHQLRGSYGASEVQFLRSHRPIARRLTELEDENRQLQRQLAEAQKPLDNLTNP